MSDLEQRIAALRMVPVIAGLEPGDVLVYKPDSFLTAFISIGDGVNSSHVATYLGNRQIAESKLQEDTTVDGKRAKGVNTYALRTDRLTHVLRPAQPFRFAQGLAWHETVRGQGYDLIGFRVFLFAKLRGNNSKMFCSEHAARFARAMGMQPFASGFDADHIKPGDFLKSPAYQIAYAITWNHGLPDITTYEPIKPLSMRTL